MGPKEGKIATLDELRNYSTFTDPDTLYIEYGDPNGWRTKWDPKASAYGPHYANGAWRWTFMGSYPTPANPFNPGATVGPELITPTTKLDKGDYCQLKVSKRKFRILDERKDSDNNFEELCKFDDDNRNPIWLPHGWLVGEVNILEKA